MTINNGMNNLTLNKNLLSPNGFKLTIDSTKFANTEYFCISSPLPSVSATEANSPFRNKQNSYPGEKVIYSPLDIRYMVTENMDNYIELFNWIVDNSNSGTVSAYDITLHILTSSNNVIRQVRFVEAFPVAIGAIDFHTQNTDVEYVIADASFQYSHFYFLK